MTDPVEDKVRQAFVDVLGIPSDSVQADSSPDTVATWDSNTHISLMMAIEEVCGVTFDPSDLMELRSFGEIVARVRAASV
jgi:acyl carrier protein